MAIPSPPGKALETRRFRPIRNPLPGALRLGPSHAAAGRGQAVNRLFLAAVIPGLACAMAHAQGVTPGGPIGGSTGIGSGIGPGSLPGGGTGPSYPNGTTVPAPAAAVPPGGYPPSGRFDTGPSGQVITRSPTTTPVPPSQYLQPRDPFGSTAQPRAAGAVTAVGSATPRIAMVSSSSGPARVIAVNQAMRVLTLAFADGRSGNYKVPGTVQTLGQVNVGDTIDVGTEQRVSFALPGLATTAPGWTVVSVDLAANTISVVDPTDGRIRAFDARTAEGRTVLPQIKPGDRLTAFATELVVVATGSKR